MAKHVVITKSNGTITNGAAALLRSKGFKVKNGSVATDVETTLTAAGHTVTLKSVFDLKPSEHTAFRKRVTVARHGKIAA